MRYSLRVVATAMLAASLFVLSGCGGAETRKASYLERGDQYFAAENFEKARVEYRNAAQIDPADPRGHFGIGRVSEKLGDLRNAVAQYQATLDLDPKHSLARASLGRLFLVGGLPEKALELAEGGLRDEPKHPQLLTVRAAVRSYEKKFDAALADAEAAFQQAQQDEYTIALLASLYRQKGEHEKAANTVRQGIERLPKNVDLRVVLADLAISQNQSVTAEEQLRKAIELEPQMLGHRIRLTRFFIAAKNVDAAETTMRDAIAAKPEDASAKMALVELLSSLRNPEAAEKQLQQFVGQAPKDYSLKLQLGAYYEQREQFDKAQQNYREVIADAGNKPDGLQARNRLAAMLLKRNDTEAASTLVSEVLKENPRDHDALVMRGNLALFQGDVSAAITDLRSVLRDQPGSVPVLRALARAHLQNNEAALAEEALRSAVQANLQDNASRLDLARLLAQSGKLEQSRSLLEQLTTGPTFNVEAQEALVRVQLALKDFGPARESARKLVEARPDLAIGHFMAGAVEETDGKPDAAIARYESALKSHPGAAEPLAALVRIELRRKHPERAASYVQKTLNAHPTHGVALNLRSELFVVQNQAKDAIASYEAAITAEPKWWIPYRGLAAAHALEKNFEASKKALQRGIEGTGGTIQLYGELSLMCEKIQQIDCAIETYEAWLRKHPSSTVAVNNLAMLLATYRKDDASMRRARELVTRLSNLNEPSVLDTRGWVDYKSGNLREAIQLFERAISQSSDSAVFKYHLAMAHLASGNSEAARKNLEAALSPGKPFVGMEEAQAALKQLQRSGA